MNDDVIIDVFRRMASVQQCSVDDILETPELRDDYLADVRSTLGNLSERDLLHRLVALRKRSKLPRLRDTLSVK